MNKRIFTGLTQIGLVLVLVLIAFAAQASPPPPGPTPPAGIPIDGGVGILVAAGAAFGVKKLRDYRKSLKEDKED